MQDQTPDLSSEYTGNQDMLHSSPACSKKKAITYSHEYMRRIVWVLNIAS